MEKVQYDRESVFQKAATEFSNLDSNLNWATSGNFDFRSVLYMVLVMAAIVQILRGQIMVPAATLLWNVFDLLRFATNKQG
ncbi:hypothetical protein [Nitrosococcus wardiae]|uniref:Uncharacterized protein n=1 Tax=Nitrosococcus wardiae TaxID=1814290 RepID=A0A4P7C058_9GAMM|nr:hypothetical protein [Nitrosococcus wardiae]QBQ55903.1 hypothetical protein E3U44_16320 [Nitrosococcus wardiae]